jgi:hypothetical protein
MLNNFITLTYILKIVQLFYSHDAITRQSWHNIKLFFAIFPL